MKKVILFLAFLLITTNAHAFKLFGLFEIGSTTITQNKDLIITNSDGDVKATIDSDTGNVSVGNMSVDKIILTNNIDDPVENDSYSIYIKNGFPYIKTLGTVSPLELLINDAINDNIQSQLSISTSNILPDNIYLTSILNYNLGYTLRGTVAENTIPVHNAISVIRTQEDGTITNGKLLLLGFNGAYNPWNATDSPMKDIFTYRDETSGSNPSNTPIIVENGDEDYFSLNNTGDSDGTVKRNFLSYPMSAISPATQITYIDVIVDLAVTRSGATAFNWFGVVAETPLDGAVVNIDNGFKLLRSAATVWYNDEAYVSDSNTALVNPTVRQKYRFIIRDQGTSPTPENFDVYASTVSTTTPWITHITYGGDWSLKLSEWIAEGRIPQFALSTYATTNDIQSKIDIYGLYIYWE